MKIVLWFDLPKFGRVKIETHTCHGSYDVLFVGGFEFTEDGRMIEAISKAIGQERYAKAMYEASANDGIYRERVSA